MFAGAVALKRVDVAHRANARMQDSGEQGMVSGIKIERTNLMVGRQM